MNRQVHWENVYQTIGPVNVSWFQRRPEISLVLISAAGTAKIDGVIDVGGGASVLADCLLDEGYSGIGVLDISAAALNHARTRLGPRADAVEWFVADVAMFKPPHRFGLWHDRAVFHFLTTAADRCAYVATLRKTLQPGGSVVISTFANDGPPKCSGLDVMRYDEPAILAELGPEFQLQEIRRESHVTPWESEQRFIYFRFRWQPAA
jgi:SAM-dependent methyltransferase